MHKQIGPIVVIALIAGIILVPGVFDALFAFLFVGIIPGINYTIPPMAMLVLYAALLAVGIYAMGHQFSTASNETKRDISSREHARKRVLRSTKQTTATAKKSAKKHLSPVTEH